MKPAFVISILVIAEWIGYVLLLRRMMGQRWAMSERVNYTLLTGPPLLLGIAAGWLSQFRFAFGWFSWLIGFLFASPLLIPMGFLGMLAVLYVCEQLTIRENLQSKPKQEGERR